jgi:hypothetical protein
LAAGPAGGRAHLDTTFMILTRAPVPCAVRVGQSEPVSPSHLFRVSQCECVILSQSVQASQSESVISPSQSFRVSQSMSVVPSKSVQSSQPSVRVGAVTTETGLCLCVCERVYVHVCIWSGMDSSRRNIYIYMYIYIYIYRLTRVDPDRLGLTHIESD